jgi:transposase
MLVYDINRHSVTGATDMAIVPVYVGLDYHSETIRVCVMDEDGETIANKNVANDPGAVRDLVRVYGGLVRGVAIEACCGAADFAAKLIELTEWTVRMAHPSAVNRLKQGPDKTDQADAWHLANLLRVGYLPEVWLADELTRQLRRLVRYRANLGAVRKDLKLQIQSLLREDRISNASGANPWTKAWLEWLKTVTLGSESRWVLDAQLQRLEQVGEDLTAVEQRLEQATAGDEVVVKLKQ